ncbi:M48 family metalloprotease, partial [Candidatus Frankia alpina]
MTAVALVPFVTSLLLACCGGRLGRRLPPATATRLLTTACLVTALATGFILAVVAFTLLAPMPMLAAAGHWSATVVRGHDPLPATAGLLGAALRRTIAVGRDLAAAELTCRRLGPAPTGLVVVDDDRADAYTLPGLTGRIVASTAMLRALPPDERRVLLAHEHSHLHHRHHVYTQEFFRNPR